MSLVIAVVSAAFTGLTFRDRRRSEREVYISRVSVHSPSKDQPYSSFLSEKPPDSVVVRNDGPSSVVVTGAGLAYGDRSVLPTQWATRRPWRFRPERAGIGRTRLLPPGSDVAVELLNEDWQTGCPGKWPGAESAVTAVAFITDAHGRAWQRTEWDWRDISEEARPLTGWPLRRGLWMERQPRLERPSRWLHRRVISRARAHPSRLPWEFHVLQWTYGWRIGPRELRLLPTNAPRTWQWPDMLPAEDRAQTHNESPG